MRVHRLAIVASLALTLAAAASAQPSGPEPQKPASQATQKAAVSTTGESLTPEQLAQEGESILRRGLAVSKSIRKMLENARKDADIIRITCLDDKLTQVNANLRSAETRVDALRAAVDADRRIHEYTVLNVIGQKLQVLDQEAQQCIGEAVYETGETTVITEIDTDMLPFEETPSVPPVVLPPSLPTVPPSVPPSASGIR